MIRKTNNIKGCIDVPMVFYLDHIKRQDGTAVNPYLFPRIRQYASPELIKELTKHIGDSTPGEYETLELLNSKDTCYGNMDSLIEDVLPPDNVAEPVPTDENNMVVSQHNVEEPHASQQNEQR
ncbi:hypothetical protein SORBI_3002G170860 [Sorghum bicolor]|uniref:Uncharacterized protein n=1 Tax=Sorghum bicolor TaxID=4558 RepID=A0A1W0W4G8_SORBI|nr:hypothetical protein SORBI_3002G170860 [Sorghum bicolor]